jgi:hypothetical protein
MVIGEESKANEEVLCWGLVFDNSFSVLRFFVTEILCCTSQSELFLTQ